jgi:hypothetical protein
MFVLIAVGIPSCDAAPPQAGAIEPVHETKASPSADGSVALSPPELVPPAPSAPVHGTKQFALQEDYKMRVKQVKECRVETYFRPREGNLKLGVEVEIEGLSDHEVPVNPFHALLRDSEGREYSPTLAGCTPDLRSLRLNKGESASGVVTFEVPRDAHRLTLTYSPFIVGRAKQELVFGLDR